MIVGNRGDDPFEVYHYYFQLFANNAYPHVKFEIIIVIIIHYPVDIREFRINCGFNVELE